MREHSLKRRGSQRFQVALNCIFVFTSVSTCVCLLEVRPRLDFMKTPKVSVTQGLEVAIGIVTQLPRS